MNDAEARRQDAERIIPPDPKRRYLVEIGTAALDVVEAPTAEAAIDEVVDTYRHSLAVGNTTVKVTDLTAIRSVPYVVSIATTVERIGIDRE